MNRFLFCLLFIGIVGCNETKQQSSKVVFAGEIVNPTSELVILYRGDTPIDTARLDSNNRFSITLDSVNEGLHHFYHHPELQYVYLEKGDSIQLRLNTINFDESLVFSGVGEEINNFMLEMFLANEMEEEEVYSMYSLEPELFSHKIDSLRDIKLTALNALNDDEFKLSNAAYDIAKAGIDYSSFIYKELYPFYHKRRKGEKSIHSLPEDFYSYRQDIDYNNASLTYLRPYFNFMKYHLGNLAYMECKAKCSKDGKMTRAQKLHFNQHKLKLIDSLVEQKELKDNLYRNVAVDYLLEHDHEKNITEFIEEFHQLSGNNKHLAEINELYEGIQSIQPNKELPQVELFDAQDRAVSLEDLSEGRKVVFYFWSGTEMGHFKNIIRKVEKLKSKHPYYSFIGINVRTDKTRWKSLLESYSLNEKEQYWAKNFDKVTHTLILSNPNKCIIAKDGMIVDAFANVYRSF